MTHQLFEYLWKCPYCHKVGRKWLTRRIARKYGRDHIEFYHKGKCKEPLLEKRRIQYAGNK